MLLRIFYGTARSDPKLLRKKFGYKRLLLSIKSEAKASLPSIERYVPKVLVDKLENITLKDTGGIAIGRPQTGYI